VLVDAASEDGPFGAYVVSRNRRLVAAVRARDDPEAARRIDFVLEEPDTMIGRPFDPPGLTGVQLAQVEDPVRRIDDPTDNRPPGRRKLPTALRAVRRKAASAAWRSRSLATPG
jgi:hypothetical protein